jgi:hypothetical protein
MRYLAMFLAIGLGTQVGEAAAPKGAAPKVGWTTDLDKMKVPDRPASGKLAGQDFKVEGVKLEASGALTLRQGKDFFPDLAVLIFLPIRAGQGIEGKSYVVAATTVPGQQRPHIHMQRRAPGEKLPKGQAFINDYAMKLEFGKAQGDRVPARIYLCLPDEGKSFVAGTFTLELK